MDDVYVGVSEIAELAGVSKQTAANWRSRGVLTVKPVRELRMGPIYLRVEIEQWLREHPERDRSGHKK